MSTAGPSLNWSLQTSWEYITTETPPQTPPTVDPQNPSTWRPTDTWNRIKDLDRWFTEKTRALWDELMANKRAFLDNLRKKRKRRGGMRSYGKFGHNVPDYEGSGYDPNHWNWWDWGDMPFDPKFPDNPPPENEIVEPIPIIAGGG
jgi:hypothetical protein